jgi:hypothetical protein
MLPAAVFTRVCATMFQHSASFFPPSRYLNYLQPRTVRTALGETALCGGLLNIDYPYTTTRLKEHPNKKSHWDYRSSILTFWRRIFFQILAHSVFKM